MGAIWDNDTIERAKQQEKALKSIWIISIIFLSILVYLILPKFNIKEFIMLIFSSSLFVVVIYAYLNKITHFRIPEELSEQKKNRIRLLFVLLSGSFFYMTWVIILVKYYPIFENFIGTLFLVNYFKI